MSTTMPEVEVSTGKATNGNTAVKTAIQVKTATTASSIVSHLKTAFLRKFRPGCHHYGIVGHIRWSKLMVWGVMVQ